MAEDAPVAETGGKQYTDLEDAFDNVSEGATITLLKDCWSGYINVKKTCTLELNGYTLHRSGFTMFYKFQFYVGKNVSFTVTDTTVDHKGTLDSIGDGGVKLNGKGGTFTLRNATIKGSLPVSLTGAYTKFACENSTIELYRLSSNYGIYASGDESRISLYNSIIKGDENNKYGIYLDGDNESVSMYGSTISGVRYGVYNYKHDSGTLTLDGKSSIDASEYAVYARGHIDTTLNGNSSMKSTGEAAVLMHAGSFTMNSGTVNASKYGVYFDKSYPSTKFTVNGGTINSGDKVTCYYDYGEQPVRGVVTVTGGWLNGGNSSGEFDASGTSMRTVEHKVSGGRFAHPVHQEWCADGYTPCK